MSDSISALYRSILGRPADSASLAADVAAVAAGLPLAQVALSLATSPEAAGDIGDIYATELGRAADSGGYAADVQYLAHGGSLAAIKASVAQSPEAAADLTAIYQNELGRVPDASGLASYQTFLANGGSLAAVQASIAASPEAQAGLANLELTVLNRPADAGGLAAYTTFLAHGGTLSEVSASLVHSPEVTADLTREYQSLTGSGPDAIELAANQSELGSGVALATLQIEIAQLRGDSVQSGSLLYGKPVNITPQIVAGAAASYVYSAGNDDAVVAASPLSGGTLYYPGLPTSADLAGRSNSYFTGFNPATDYIQVQSYQKPYSAVPAFDGYGVTIDLGDGAQIELVGVSPSSFQSSDIRVSTAPTAVEFDISNLYQTILGRAPDSGGLAYYAQYVADGGTLAGVQTALVNSAELVGDISSAYQSALGHPANAVEIAAGQSELQSNVTFATLQAELGQLSGGPAPDPTPYPVPITPQTIAGDAPNLVYSLLNNDALITSTSIPVTDFYGNGSGAEVYGFNPATNIIQLQAAQTFAAPGPAGSTLQVPDGQNGDVAYVQISGTTDNRGYSTTTISLPGDKSISLSGISDTSLTAANFRIV